VLTVTTALIISIVRSSVALSLGLVGALSIVRFRAAIKEPEETRLPVPCHQRRPRPRRQRHPDHHRRPGPYCWLDRDPQPPLPPAGPPNLYLTVTSPAAANLGASQILAALAAVAASATLKTLRPDARSDRGRVRGGLQASRQPGAVQPTPPRAEPASKNQLPGRPRVGRLSCRSPFP